MSTSNRTSPPAPRASFEPSSWTPVVAIGFTAVGCFSLFAVVALLTATEAGAAGLLWLAVPIGFFAGGIAVLMRSERRHRKQTTVSAPKLTSLGSQPSPRAKLRAGDTA